MVKAGKIRFDIGLPREIERHPVLSKSMFVKSSNGKEIYISFDEWMGKILENPMYDSSPEDIVEDAIVAYTSLANLAKQAMSRKHYAKSFFKKIPYPV